MGHLETFAQQRNLAIGPAVLVILHQVLELADMIPNPGTVDAAKLNEVWAPEEADALREAFSAFAQVPDGNADLK